MNEVLVDSFGRRHNNLRISVTDRCNIRCTYCMPEEVSFQPKENLLSFEEIAAFVEMVAPLGINKLRLTGGEPLMRKDLHRLVKRLVRISGIDDVGLTTNGVMLAEQAQGLYDAGLRRLNVSLDTLSAEQFQIITRRDVMAEVLEGIEAARRAGFRPIKLNAVAMKGVTDDQVVRLAIFCRERELEMRFIEFMPLEADHIWDRSKVLTSDEILAMLADAGLPTRPIPSKDPHAPASEFEYLDGKGRVGIIASVSKPFCGDCNRIRLTADGKLRNCLFSLDEVDIKGPLRAGASCEEIADLVRSCVKGKWIGHQINSANFVRPERTMHSIGG
ncbi:MAG: GTP 3',8-cyclase MoaA [Planctomycetota bacterium]